MAVLCGLAFAVSGCGAGIGPGSDDGAVELVVTRDYGRTPVVGPEEVELASSDTVIRVLERTARIETSYGGRFVDAVDGIENTSSPRSRDWFYFVNGIAADVGAAEYDLGPGDSIWWDYRDWTAAMDVGAVTGSYPAPLAPGPDGSGGPVGFSCSAPEPICGLARKRLSDDGVELDRSDRLPVGEVARVVVGQIGDLGDSVDSGDFDLDADPDSSGVFARFRDPDGDRVALEALDETGTAVETFGSGAGLVAAVRDPGKPPVWVVTGTDHEGVEAATAALDPEVLDSTYAVVLAPDGGDPIPVPIVGGEGGGE